MTDDIIDSDFEDEFDETKSKTKLKQEMLELQELGVKLTQVSNAILDKLPLDDLLRKAIDEYKNIHHKNAQKRHRQYIGKLMRSSESDAIKQVLDELDQERLRHSRQFHIAEKWRTQLVDGGNDILETFINEFPTVDRQQLRHLQRAAQRDKSNNKNTGATKKLFRMVQIELSNQSA